MADRKTKPTKEDLISRLPSSGWEMKTGIDGAPLKDYTLEEAVRAAHLKHKNGESFGIVSQIETAIELDLIQLQLLWEYLGLPM